MAHNDRRVMVLIGSGA